MEVRIALPEQVALSYHKGLADSYAIEAILEGKTSQGWLKIPLHQIGGRNQISAHGLIKQLEIEALKLTWQAEAPRELCLRQIRLTLEAKK